MRRMQKPVITTEYPGENHSPARLKMEEHLKERATPKAPAKKIMTDAGGR